MWILSVEWRWRGPHCAAQKKKRRKSSEIDDCRRVKRRTCGFCGFSRDTPIENGNASLFPRTRKAIASGTIISASAEVSQAPEIVPVKRSSSLPLSSSVGSSDPRIGAPTASPYVPLAQACSKSRPKKKPGLQDMLSCNREKEAKQREGKAGGQGGLAAFLSGL